MITSTLDEAATSAADRYQGFLMSLRGVLGASMSKDPRDQRAFQIIRDGGYQLAEPFLDSEVRHYTQDLNAVGDQAIKNAQKDMGVTAASDTDQLAYREEMAVWFRQELRAQIERDINVVVAKRRHIAVQAQTQAYGRGKDVTGIFASLIRVGQDKVDFYFTDRAGRKYPAQKYVRGLYRHGLVTLGVQSYAMEAASLGATTARVTHPEPDHTDQGKIISLTGQDKYPSLADIMPKVFHPNSRAFLKAEAA